MDAYKETFDSWNKVAAIYQDKFMDLTLYNETYDFFCGSLETGKRNVLEIGCGPGNITRYLLALRPELNILALDVAPNMIALAQQNNPAATCRVMDCRDISQLDARFDAIISGFCLPYLNEQDCAKLITDCATLLAPEGLLYLSFVDGNTEASGPQTGSTGNTMYFYYHELSAINKNMENNGFTMLKLFRVNYTKGDGSTEVHTIVVARKNEMGLKVKR